KDSIGQNVPGEDQQNSNNGQTVMGGAGKEKTAKESMQDTTKKCIDLCHILSHSYFPNRMQLQENDSHAIRVPGRQTFGGVMTGKVLYNLLVRPCSQLSATAPVYHPLIMHTVSPLY